jgi:hypothetical protein
MVGYLGAKSFITVKPPQINQSESVYATYTYKLSKIRLHGYI